MNETNLEQILARKQRPFSKKEVIQWGIELCDFLKKKFNEKVFPELNLKDLYLVDNKMDIKCELTTARKRESIRSLGICLFHLTTDAPFQVAFLLDGYPLVRKLNPEVSGDFEEVVKNILSTETGKKGLDIDKVRQNLEKILSKDIQAVKERPPTTVAKIKDRVRGRVRETKSKLPVESRDRHAFKDRSLSRDKHEEVKPEEPTPRPEPARLSLEVIEKKFISISKPLRIRSAHSKKTKKDKVVFAPNSSFLASSGDDNKIKLWNTERNFKKEVFGGFDEPVNSLTVSPDSRLIALGSGDEIVVKSVSPSHVNRLTLPHHNSSLSLAFSPDGKYLASGNSVGNVDIIDPKSLEIIQVLREPEGKIYDLNFSPDGRFLVAGSNGEAVIWDGYTFEYLRIFFASIGVKASVFSPDNKYLALSYGSRVEIQGCDKGFSRISSPMCFEGLVVALAFSPSSQYLAVSDRDGKRIIIINCGEGFRRVNTIKVDGTTSSLSFSPDGRFLAAAGEGEILIFGEDVKNERDNQE